MSRFILIEIVWPMDHYAKAVSFTLRHNFVLRLGLAHFVPCRSKNERACVQQTLIPSGTEDLGHLSSVS